MSATAAPAFAPPAYPDARSFRRKFGLLVPATNTSMEHELWSLVGRNPQALAGVGLHSVPVVTPAPALRTDADRLAYRDQFLGGLQAAVKLAQLAAPEHLIMGMSLEHILAGLDAVRAPVAQAAAWSGLPWAAWHDAAHAALTRYGARRIGLLTPFDRGGTESAARLFADLGYEVGSSLGFACADARLIAHVPDWAKERAIVEGLDPRGKRLDAVVQCGTNMSLVDVTERLEPRLGIPILGINAALFWHALRQSGITGALAGGGRLLREF